MSQSKVSDYWSNRAFSVFRFLWFTLSELYDGITQERLNIVLYLVPGAVIAFLATVRLDYWVSIPTGLDWLVMPIGVREAVVYTCAFSGFFIWAGERAFYRVKLLAKLREAFLYCSLEASRKLPAFIEDTKVDEFVRKLKLFTNGIPLKKFLENRENLEGQLNITIVRMYEEPNDKSRINIVYAMRGLEPLVHMEDPSAYTNGDIPIGKTYGGEIHVNLRDVGHILVAGQTGGGKSNFLKVVTSTLTLNNPEADVFFLDFKGGMELADMLNKLGKEQSNFYFKAGPSPCVEQLAQIGKSIESRLSEIAKSGASTFDEYLKRRLALPKAEGEIDRGVTLKRTYIIVDEIAQLYARDPGVAKETLMSARDAVNRIARQGRAAAVHLIVATQKPDSVSFDQTVKSNLPAVLCFPMVSQAASVSAIGTKRAYDLNPESKVALCGNSGQRPPRFRRLRSLNPILRGHNVN